LPIAPGRKGKPWFPEHSSVKTTSFLGKALSAARSYAVGRATWPAICSFHFGDPVVPDAEELLVRGDPRIRRLGFPVELVEAGERRRRRGRLVDERDSRLTRSGPGEEGALEEGNGGQRATGLDQGITAGDAAIVHRGFLLGGRPEVSNGWAPPVREIEPRPGPGCRDHLL